MSYLDLIKSRGEDYINRVRCAPFEFDGDEYAFMFYEVNRVAWCIAADMQAIEIWTANAERRVLDHDGAQRWLERATGVMTESARIFHEGKA